MRKVYMNNAATTWPKPQEVPDAVYAFMTRDGANASRGSASERDIKSLDILFTARAKAANFATACAVRSIASAESAPLARIPSPSFVMTFMSHIMRAPPSAAASPSVSFTEFVPISITAFFII